MKVIMKRSWVLVLLFLLFISMWSFAFALDEEYLSDTLKRPAYRASWDAMFKREKHVPSWLANYAKTYNGPTSPCKALNIDGVEYKVHSVCKAHDCGANMFIVLFAPEGRQAWGVLFTSSQRFFGHPDQKKKDALIKAKDCD
jgi:hypothetical protein